MEKLILHNGITLYYYPLNNLHSTAIGLYINSGSVSESKETNGITHLLEHLHFRRLGDMNQSELYFVMDKIGANLRASTHKEMMRFYLKVRPMFFDETIKLFQSIITMDDWKDEDFETEKKVVYNEILSKEPYVYTDPILDSMIWDSNPLAMPIAGTKESIVNLKLDDVIRYKKRIFSSGNVALVVTGYLTKEMMQNIKKSFDEIPALPKIERKMNLCTVPNSLKVKLLTYKWDYVDVKISFKVEENTNLYELMVLNSILGGGTTSKLQCVIREELALTSDIYSYVESFEAGNNIRISYTTHKSNIYTSVSEIVSVLNKLKSEISNKDMEANLPYFTENLWYWLDDSEFLNLEIGWDVFKTENPLTVEERIQKYQKIAKADLMNLSEKTFVPDNASVLIAGSVEHISEKKIRDIMSQLLM